MICSPALQLFYCLDDSLRADPRLVGYRKRSIFRRVRLTRLRVMVESESRNEEVCNCESGKTMMMHDQWIEYESIDWNISDN